MKHQATPWLVATAGSLALLSCTATSTFDATDTNSDGRISTPEMQRILTESVFSASDANRDGQVTLAEWRAANPSDDVSIFNDRDLNRDGVVTLEEFTKHVADNGTFDEIIAQLDPGEDGTVSIADFDAFMLKHKLG